MKPSEPPFIRYHDGTVAALPAVDLVDRENPLPQTVVDLRGAERLLFAADDSDLTLSARAPR